jgi:hypothetical protein
LPLPADCALLLQDAPITRRDFAVLLELVYDNKDDSHAPQQPFVPNSAVVPQMERSFDVKRNRPDELQLKVRLQSFSIIQPLNVT